MKGLCQEARRILTLSERGNSLFVSDDGNLVFVADLGEQDDGAHLFFFVTYVASDYPAFHTSFLEAGIGEVRRTLQDELVGWLARKNNIGLVLDDDGYVGSIPELEDAVQEIAEEHG